MASEGTPDFYGETIGRLLRAGLLTIDMEVLVTCGGSTDRDILRQHGFRQVTITNVDPQPRRKAFAPYRWAFQDAEHLTYDDSSFDFCIVHSGLHHCHSPHRALLEMYRVASKGLLLFEPYDSLLTRIGTRLHIGQEYEHAGVRYHNFARGGVRDSPIPNYVYRWTEKEIVKTISCYAPYARHEIRFFHRTRVPWGQLRARRSKALYVTMLLAQPGLRLIELCLPKQSNNFAALVLKPELPGALHPWLRQEGTLIVLDPEWVASRYPRRPRKRAAGPEARVHPTPMGGLYTTG